MSLLPLFFLLSCKGASAWSYNQEPRRAHCGAQLACESEVHVNGMRLQLIKTEEGTTPLLGIFFSKYTVDDDFCTTVNLRSGDLRDSYKARCLEGRQRCVLPDEALNTIRAQLEKGEAVVLHTKRQMLKLEPGDFAKLMRKMEKR